MQMQQHQHMQAGPAPPPHMGMPPMSTSPRASAPADRSAVPPPVTAQGGKPAGLNVAAQSFIPSQLRGPPAQQPQQQFPAPPMMMGNMMPNGPPMNPQAMAHFRQQQQQHMMFQQHQMQQHMQQQQQQQQFAQASQPPQASKRVVRGQDGDNDAAEEGDDEGERHSPLHTPPAPPPGGEGGGGGMPFVPSPVRTSTGQGNGPRSAAKDSAVGLHDMPQSPQTTLIVDAADNSDSSTNTENGLNVYKRSNSLSVQQQRDDSVNGSADLEGVSLASKPMIELEPAASLQNSDAAPSKQQLATTSAPTALASVGLLNSSSAPDLQSGSSTMDSTSWKRKLQLNMTVQVQAAQPSPRQPGSGRSVGGASPLSNQVQSKSSSFAGGLQAMATVPAARPGASSQTSAALMAAPPAPLPGFLKALPFGRYAFLPADPLPGGEARNLPLVRGLLNSDADNNCFLNVIVQSLWHLSAFRGPMLATSWASLEAKSGASLPADRCVMAAIWRIFRAMAADPAADSSGDVSAEAKAKTAAAGVSPRELRSALCGQSTIHVDPTDMHDAGEVFAEILGILHRAELGKPVASPSAGNAVFQDTDLQLPRRVKVAVQRLKKPALEGPSSSHQVSAPASPSSPSPYAAALMAGVPSTAALSAAQDLATQRPATLVHRVFGLDVQMPCPPSDSDSRGSSCGSKAAPRGGSGRRSPPLSSAAAVEPRSLVTDNGLVEVQQFTKVSPIPNLCFSPIPKFLSRNLYFVST